MSDALGAVRFADGLVLFFVYHGTSDVCCPALVENPESRFDEVYGHGSWDKSKACQHAEPVTIYSDYGRYHWSGKACRSCRVITFGHCPYDMGTKPVVWIYERDDPAPDLTNGTPEWFTVAMDHWAVKNGFKDPTP